MVRDFHPAPAFDRPAGGEGVAGQLVDERLEVSAWELAGEEWAAALAELLSADLSELDLVCLMVDGVHFGEHTGVVALGIAIDGTKHPLALVEGSTENAALARELLVGLRERGLEVTRPILCVIDGAKALRRAITDVFDHPARCTPPTRSSR
jgi:putative transposase